MRKSLSRLFRLTGKNGFRCRSLFLLILGPYLFFALGFCSTRKVKDEDLADKMILAAEALYQSPVWTNRVSAIQNAALWPSPRSEELILTALNDPHIRVRIEAMKSLPVFRSTRVYETIRQIAENEKDDNMLFVTLSSLGQFQNPKSAQIFIKCLSNDEWIIRESSIIGLLDIPDPGVEKLSVQYIINSLSDSNDNVRIAALTHLRIKDERLYFILKEIIRDASVYYKPVYCTALLKALNGYEYDVVTRSNIIRYITHPNQEIRVLALRGIQMSDSIIRIKSKNIK
jgi:HEAT repeat protein